EGGEGLKVEERVIGGYACPEIVLSQHEEKRIQRPWRRGVIVKLLGRRIGYKALETRLRQMWVRKGVISIIDLSNDYYLVAFSHEEDQYAALMDGPWFIYDHYLTVKEWSPNFHPASDTIKKVAVWVRISGLPIEYYDAKVLHFIGNIIGKTVRVDKNTLTQERGKYARLCVEVDLTKALLAMFTIKGRKYNVEYEGLHLLCTTCGRFGHYKEGCPEKNKIQSVGEIRIETNGKGGGENGGGTHHMEGSTIDGPWKVVQKTKRAKKGKERETPTVESGSNKSPAKINAGAKNTGSRFAALTSDEVNLETDNIVINEERMHEGMTNLHVSQEPIIISNNTNNNNGKILEREVSGNKGSQRLEGTIKERITKESKLSAKVKGNFKGKPRASLRKPLEHVAKLWVNKNMGDFIGIPLEKKGGDVGESSMTHVENKLQREVGKSGTNDMGLEMGLSPLLTPNLPRPPDTKNTPPGNGNSPSQNEENSAPEKEEFEDANDQGITGSSDSEMDFVDETPPTNQ
ncbi:hypothetical protein A2U01_0005153, partial [Trifolium medium]|nr:hypothetical protein [Trifolium medium]